MKTIIIALVIVSVILMTGCIEHEDGEYKMELVRIEITRIEQEPTREIVTLSPTPSITSFQGMEILSKYDDDRDGILNNAEKVEITDLFMRDMLTPPQREAYIAIWGDPTYRRIRR